MSATAASAAEGADVAPSPPVAAPPVAAPPVAAPSIAPSVAPPSIVAAPAATMQPQDSSLCGGCAIYSFSPHTATKVIMPARGDAKETKRSLVGDYRGEYWR